MTPDDLALLVRAAQNAGLDPAKLQAENPWKFEGTVAMTLQSALSDLDPEAAERLQEEAGVKLSLGAQAAMAGLQQWSVELEQELAKKAPASFQKLRAAELELAAEQAFGAFNARREEARQLAASHDWNVDALVQMGHHLAATVAAEHREQQAQELRRQQQVETDHIRRIARSTGR